MLCDGICMSMMSAAPAPTGAPRANAATSAATVAVRTIDVTPASHTREHATSAAADNYQA
jgi:hypothetical protein